MADNITVLGVKELRGKFAKMDSKLQKNLIDATDKSVAVVLTRAKTYPPARPSSKYRRTGTLGRRWTGKTFKNSKGPWGRVNNRTRYGKWVMGEQDQANVHRGRWARTDQIAEEMSTKVNRFYEHAVESAIK